MNDYCSHSFFFSILVKIFVCFDVATCVCDILLDVETIGHGLC